MAKYNILLVINQRHTGLQYHRQIIPHSYMGLHDEDFNIMSVPNIEGITEEQLKDIHMVQFLREVDPSWTDKSLIIIETLQKMGIKVVFDIDDYWILDKNHLLYETYKQFDVARQTVEIIKTVDYVTTTTSLMANKIRLYNENVEVIANAIDTDQDQWKIRKIESDLIRFGWIGGVHHKEDIRSVENSFIKLFADKTIRNKFQLCLAGFNTSIPFNKETLTDLKNKGFLMDIIKSGNYADIIKHFVDKNYLPPVAEFVNLERIFTNDYKIFRGDNEYLNYLKQFTQAMEHFANNKPYKRLWGKDVYGYGDLYNSIDVALVPLLNTPFNNCKSQLKIIEAGMMKKAVIVSDVYPYTIDCNSDNSILIKEGRNGIDFFTAMRRLTLNPSMIQDLAEKLHETVRVEYHISTQNTIRTELYKTILQ